MINKIKPVKGYYVSLAVLSDEKKNIAVEFTPILVFSYLFSLFLSLSPGYRDPLSQTGTNEKFSGNSSATVRRVVMRFIDTRRSSSLH